jgi:hypothetical protein
MEAICSSETSVKTQRATRRYIPEVDTLHNHHCENLKSYKVTKFWVTRNGTKFLVRREVLMAATMKIVIRCYMTPRSMVEVYGRFGGMFVLYL